MNTLISLPLNAFEIDTLRSVIVRVSECAYEAGDMQVVVADTNSPGWRIYSYEAGDCPHQGLFVSGHGVEYAVGEDYEQVLDQLGGPAP